MKKLIKKTWIRLIAGLLVLALGFSAVSVPALAQPPRRPGMPVADNSVHVNALTKPPRRPDTPPPNRSYGPPPSRPYGPPPPPNRSYGPPPSRPYGPPPPPYHHHDHHHPSDLEKTLGVIGAVGAIAAIANGQPRYPYYPYRYAPQPVVVVEPRRPPLVVEKQVIVEKPVIIERQVTVPSDIDGSYSPKLGASFRIERMQIPGNKFTAARLTSDPVEGSPLYGIGLRKGDVLTRLDDNAADSLAELDRHEKNTLIRYIKTGTTKVLLANVYIPTDRELQTEGETYYAP